MTSEWGEDGKCVGSEMWDCAGLGAVGLGHTWHDKSSRAGEADGAVAQGHATSLPGTAWTWHCDIRGKHGDNCEVR